VVSALRAGDLTSFQVLASLHTRLRNISIAGGFRLETAPRRADPRPLHEDPVIWYLDEAASRDHRGGERFGRQRRSRVFSMVRKSARVTKELRKSVSEPGSRACSPP